MRLATRLLRFSLALLRELSDESAYGRYLAQSGKSHSASEWKHFIDGRHRRKYRNAKCC